MISSNNTQDLKRNQKPHPFNLLDKDFQFYKNYVYLEL